ncbi:MAG: hypothetical protein ABSG40_05200 [Terriglobales bacterium]|jgi:hypothetical protein
MDEVPMDADFSIELRREDPVLDFPWKDPAGKFAYIELKRRPELMSWIEEAKTFPELGEFLRTLNSARSTVETAKCDAWETTELSAEEDVYDASHKFASYVDVVFSNIDARLSSLRQSFFAHEQFARKLVELLRRAPETPSAAEVCVRRCYFGEEGGVREGFYCTLYVSGYGNDGASARQNWGVGLKLTGNAIVELSAGGDAASRVSAEN